MKRPCLDLHYLSNRELVDMLSTINEIDRRHLDKSMNHWSNYSHNYHKALYRANERYEHLRELLCRLESFNWIVVSHAIDEVFEKSRTRVDWDEIRFILSFNGQNKPELINLTK